MSGARARVPNSLLMFEELRHELFTREHTVIRVFTLYDDAIIVCITFEVYLCFDGV